MFTRSRSLSRFQVLILDAQPRQPPQTPQTLARVNLRVSLSPPYATTFCGVPATNASMFFFTVSRVPLMVFELNQAI